VIRICRAVLALATLAAITACASAAGPAATTAPATTASAPASTAAVTSTPAPTATPAPATTIDIGDHFFLPTSVTVAVGTNVTWVNRGQQGHTATAVDGSFASATLDFNQAFTFTFTRVGRFDYYCATHTDMLGAVEVR
jgi:plastocyanin